MLPLITRVMYTHQIKWAHHGVPPTRPPNHPTPSANAFYVINSEGFLLGPKPSDLSNHHKPRTASPPTTSTEPLPNCFCSAPPISKKGAPSIGDQPDTSLAHSRATLLRTGQHLPQPTSGRLEHSAPTWSNTCSVHC